MTSRHHIVPSSRGGVNSRENITRLPDHVHIGHHMVYGNALPHESIRQMAAMTWTALSDEFRGRMIELLNNNDTEAYYRTGIIKRKTSLILKK